MCLHLPLPISRKKQPLANKAVGAANMDVMPPMYKARQAVGHIASKNDEVARHTFKGIPVQIPIPFPRFPLISSLPAPRLTADMDKVNVVVWWCVDMAGAGVVATTAVFVVGVAVVANVVKMFANYLLCFLAFVAAFYLVFLPFLT